MMTNNQPWLDTTRPFEERARLLLEAMTDEEKLSQINYRNAAIPRLGLHAYVWWNEALHGLARAGAATVFPQPIGLAATFQPARVRQMGEIIAKEGRAKHHECARQGDFGTYKGLTYFSPNVNIFRDPRWGRGHETYGECPFLTGQMGAAYVTGVQGEHPHYLQAVATPKHFAVHSGPELTRLSFNAVVDERDLRETYLPAFRACFAAGAHSVMTAYNAINGEPCATNDYLVNRILRDEWGFTGAVVTDAGAGEALYKEHQTVADYPAAVARELSRGIDVIVDWEVGAEAAWQRGLIAAQDLDRAVYNQLLVKFRLGFFDDPATVPLADTPLEVIECPEHLAAARQASRESLVLLKNDAGLLPLDRTALRNIAVIGPNADARDILLGNYFGTPTTQVTILQGIQHAVAETCRVWHARGCEHTCPRTEPCAEDYDRYAEAVAVAQRCDVVLLCLGLSPTIEGEAGDAFNADAGGDKLRLELPDPQEELLRRLAATGTPIVVLMLAGSAVISAAVEEQATAMLHCWYPGAEGGTAIADALFGDYTPGGRLPVTFYRTTADLPAFESYAMDGRTYRFFTGEPAYPFGFGLSYTRFAYADLTVDRQSDGIAVQVTVTNTGDRAGDEVVQVYASQEAPFRTPLRRLVAFKRVHLAPGQRMAVALRVEQQHLALTDPAGRQALHAGPITLAVGGSQPDARSVALLGRAPLSATIALDAMDGIPGASAGMQP
jgi:beta-glucosidase